MNTIHQLCSLRDPQATSGAASFAASQEVHVQVIYDRLSKLLSVLVTIDGIILGHDSLRGKVLTILGYWAVHKLRNAAGVGGWSAKALLMQSLIWHVINTMTAKTLL